jgi:fibronectin type 3 domain-containing protein
VRLLALLFTLSLAAQSFDRATITFAWDANTEPDLAGYRLYVREGTNSYSRVASTTNTMCSVTFTNVALYSIYVTAVNTSTMESLPSNVLTINTKAPQAPATFKLQQLDIRYVVK